MPMIELEGGTDIAEVLLFSVDDLPSGGVDDNALAKLASSNLAIRMPTGGDGGYLLHLYVDEEIPDSQAQYCAGDDILESDFYAQSGKIAFGGAESAHSDFTPNSNIRSDSEIPPGRYRATAYHTDYPDQLTESAIEDAIGPDGIRAMSFPSKIVLGTIVVTVLFAVVGINVNALALVGAAISFGSGVFWYKTYTRSDEYLKYEAEQRRAQSDFPSIVIRLMRRDR